MHIKHQFIVTCDCTKVYANHAELNHLGRLEIAAFSFRTQAEDFINRCLNGYYTNVKIENQFE